jgi:hypothetical protein
LLDVLDQDPEQRGFLAGVSAIEAGWTITPFFAVHREFLLGRNQFAQFPHDRLWFQAMHHGPERDRFHIHTGAGEATIAKVLFDDVFPTRHVPNDIANQTIVCDFHVRHYTTPLE